MPHDWPHTKTVMIGRPRPLRMPWSRAWAMAVAKRSDAAPGVPAGFIVCRATALA